MSAVDAETLAEINELGDRAALLGGEAAVAHTGAEAARAVHGLCALKALQKAGKPANWLICNDCGEIRAPNIQACVCSQAQ